MFQGCRYKPTNEIKIEINNKIENKWQNLSKNIIDLKTLVLSFCKVEGTRIKYRD